MKLSPPFARLALAALPLISLAGDARPDDARPGADTIGDPYYPGLGAGGYDVQHYDLVLDVDMETGAIEAVATLTALALHGLTSFNLDLHKLDIASIEVDGDAAQFTRDGRELQIVPAATIPGKTEFVVRITYSGVPELVPDPATRGAGVGWQRTDSGIFVSSQCIGAASWFPCNDHQRDRATFSFTVTAPKPYVVAANGILIEEKDLGDARTYVWRSKYPMAPYLATVGIAEFEVRVEEGPGGMPLRTYYAKTLSEEDMAGFSRQAEIVEFLELCFGPYPFESVGAIVADEFLGGALETQTIPVYGRGAFGDDTIAHELAHMWFGDAVTANNWKDMWLNEGFASFGALLWMEFAHGEDAADALLRRTYGMLRRAEVGPPPDPGVEGVFSPRVYDRGMWVLHCLRTEVDEEVFFEILQTWFEKKSGATATTEEFLEHCDEISGQDLEEFFAGVLFAPVIPKDDRYET